MDVIVFEHSSKTKKYKSKSFLRISSKHPSKPFQFPSNSLASQKTAKKPALRRNDLDG
jgi:hypothetical protein